MNNVLVLAAHPDDETLGAGGTIAKLAAAGHNIKLLTFTDGISSREDGDRRHELEQVSKILGIKEFKAFDFPDNEMDSISLLKVVKKIEDFLDESKFNPNLVLTQNPYCLNVDHNIVYRATMTAFRGLKRFNPIKIMCYEVVSSSEWNPLSHFMPNCYVDVSQFVDKKLAALEVYSDEMLECPHPRSVENVINKMKVNGTECGLAAAERFQIVREVIL